MKLFMLNILLVGLLLSCANDGSKEKLTYSMFEASLNTRMDYEAIVKEFGVPDKDLGSGIHIYVYELNDSTEIWIGYTDQILYAKHVDQTEKVLHTLI